MIPPWPQVYQKHPLLAPVKFTGFLPNLYNRELFFLRSVHECPSFMSFLGFSHDGPGFLFSWALSVFMNVHSPYATGHALFLSVDHPISAHPELPGGEKPFAGVGPADGTRRLGGG